LEIDLLIAKILVVKCMQQSENLLNDPCEDVF